MSCSALLGIFYYSYYKLNLFNYINSLEIFEVKQNMFIDTSIYQKLSGFNYIFMLTISVISLFANYHTFYYMKLDQKKERFLLLLNGFSFSMCFLVISINLFAILLS